MTNGTYKNAWAVKYRFNRKGESRDWLTQTTYPAMDVIEYDDKRIDQFKFGDTPSFDIGQGRAAVEALRLQSDHGKKIETRVDFVYFQPFDTNPPNGRITLIAQFDNTRN